jgi:large subunit ribosomal protein L30
MELSLVAEKIRIIYAKSSIGYERSQRATLQALGLRKLNQSVVHDDNSVIRGMIKKVNHLVVVEEVE